MHRAGTKRGVIFGLPAPPAARTYRRTQVLVNIRPGADHTTHLHNGRVSAPHPLTHQLLTTAEDPAIRRPQVRTAGDEFEVGFAEFFAGGDGEVDLGEGFLM